MVVQAISDGYGISDVPHWNHDKYSNQRIITVMINGYAYLVTYVKDGGNYFLKTIIPSRQVACGMKIFSSLRRKINLTTGILSCIPRIKFLIKLVANRCWLPLTMTLNGLNTIFSI